MTRFISVAMAVFLLSACATSQLLEGRKLVESGQVEAGLEVLKRALEKSPNDKELRVFYFRQRDLLVARELAVADQALREGRNDLAEAAYRKALGHDAGSQRAQAGMNEVAAQRRREGLLNEARALIGKGDLSGAESRLRVALAENALFPAAREMMREIEEKNSKSQESALGKLGPAFAKPVTLEFRDAPLRGVFESISRSTGLNFVFDREVKSDTKITVFLRNTTVEDALGLILMSNQLERKLLNANTMLVYPSTPAKIRDYQELVTRSFFLANADAKQVQTLVKQVVKSKDVYVDEKLNLLVVKDTPDAIRLAERLIESMDIAEPEVVLEVEVLEVQRSKLLQLGLQFPSEVGYGLLKSDSTTTTIINGVTQSVTNPGGSIASGMVDLRNRKGLTTYVANPALLLNLKDQDSDAKTLANPRIRVKNREKAKIHIGEKLPVFTTTATANVGVAASVNYLDVGLKLDVEPLVHLDQDVEMKVSLEVSNVSQQVQGPNGSVAYQIGTRSVGTALRLRDGETQVLAGLINDEERKSASRFPGLGELPLIGKLFSNEGSTDSRSEIVLLITPRIMRTLARPQLSANALASGTEKTVGAPALSVRAGSAGPLKVETRSSGAATPSAPAAEAAPAASSEQAPAALTPSTTLNVPSVAAPGSELIVSAVVSAPGQNLASGQVEFSYDAAIFEALDPAAGGAVPLTVSGESGTASIRLRVKGDARGMGAISVSDGRVKVGSTDLGIDLPQEARVRIRGTQ